MTNTFSEVYFVDGGTLRANTPSYVKRPADDELFNALMNGEYCYILTARQMGKSSLMIRTSQKLKERNIQSAVVDIQGIGINKIREWYASLLSRIRRGLKLSVDIDAWMKQKSNIGFGLLFSEFIQDVVLTEIADPVVIFLDEVDWMIMIDFRDDFLASIRSIYNARAQYPEFNRISFVLLGVASPADLISEPTRTPFNIGHSIPLQELSLEDATPLQYGLELVCPGEGKRILERIFYWTNGHPYLTQKICKSIAEAGRADWHDSDVDLLVERLFLTEESRKEANLKFIQDRILSNEQSVQMLKIYSRVRRTKVRENGQSILQNQLMLSGLLTSRDGYLEVRNLIYHVFFNDRWINQNTPKIWQRIPRVSVRSLVVLLASLALVLAAKWSLDSIIQNNIAQATQFAYFQSRLNDQATLSAIQLDFQSTQIAAQATNNKAQIDAQATNNKAAIDAQSTNSQAQLSIQATTNALLINVNTGNPELIATQSVSQPTSTIVFSGTSETDCTKPQRLVLGEHAVVVASQLSVNLSPGNDTGRVNVLAKDRKVSVMDGPVCVDQIWWWKVFYNGQTIPDFQGWAGEGDGTGYWLAPVP